VANGWFVVVSGMKGGWNVSKMECSGAAWVASGEVGCGGKWVVVGRRTVVVRRLRRPAARRPPREARGPRAAAQRPPGAAGENFENKALSNEAPSAKIEDRVSRPLCLGVKACLIFNKATM
jgi:hypothetical protein